MLVIIPAYKPDHCLTLLCKKLLQRRIGIESGIEILVVDDGSGSEYSEIFSAVKTLGPAVHLLSLPSNGGKGAALRAGFAWAQSNRPEAIVVTADADGQHLPADILAVGLATEIRHHAQEPALVLGVRTVEDPHAPTAKTPWRSRYGNALTVGFFALATGQKIADTQTGLRGFTPDILDWALGLPGNRYEFEFTMLLRATRAPITICQVPITKVYEPGNPSSHFQPVRDSLRIYAPLLGFLAASLAGFATDTLALLVYVGLGLHVVAAVVAARVTSALLNFALNRWMMQDGAARPSTRNSLVRYAMLAGGILLVNASLMEALTWLGLALLVAKVLVEAALIPVSFAVQRRWVFLPKQQVTSSPAFAGEPEVQVSDAEPMRFAA